MSIRMQAAREGAGRSFQTSRLLVFMEEFMAENTHTNEELVAMIQGGRNDLTIVLWDQVERFAFKEALKRYQKTVGFDGAKGFGGVEVNDLMQSAFLAMLEATQTYDAGAGGKFITWFSFYLRKAFNEAQGYRTERQTKDPLNSAKSFDRPVYADDNDNDITLGDLTADPRDHFGELEEQVYNDELHAALDAEIETLSSRQSDAIRLQYWQGKTLKEAGEIMSVSPSAVRVFRNDGIKQLRRPKHRHKLEAFLDRNTPFYLHVGVQAFNSKHESAVERLVFMRDKLARKNK